MEWGMCMRRFVQVSLVAAALGFGGAGCYGPFRLTQNLHSWNKDVGGKWTREGVFLLMTIVPVYPFATLGDALIFNSIEFWGGSNPIATGPSNKKKATLSQGNIRTILTYSSKDKTLDIDAFQNENHYRSFRIEPTKGGGMAMRDQNGRLVLFAKTLKDGGITITNFKGNTIAQYSADEAQRIIARY